MGLRRPGASPQHERLDMKLDLETGSSHVATGGRAHLDSAPYVLFLHGSGQSHLTWVLQTRYFAYEGYNIIAPDLPGHGLSGGAPLTTIDQMADWAAGLLDTLKVAKAAVVGHSQGCLIALELASRHSGLVDRVCLIAGAAAIPVNDYLINSAASKPDAAIAMMTGWGHGQTGHFHDNTQPGFSHLGFGRALMAANQQDALHADLVACNAYDKGAEAAAAVTQPCHLILAGADKMTPVKQGRKLAQLVSQATVTEIPGAGHMLPSEHPDEVNAPLARFLAS